MHAVYSPSLIAILYLIQTSEVSSRAMESVGGCVATNLPVTLMNDDSGIFATGGVWSVSNEESTASFLPQSWKPCSYQGKTNAHPSFFEQHTSD